MLTGLKVASFTCQCVFYRPEHNVEGGPHWIEFWRSSNVDWEVLSVNPSANVFVFGDFNVHHRDWLTYSGGTGRPGELCYNFCISNDLTQIGNFLTRTTYCDSHSPALLDLFLSSDAIICSTMAFPPLGNADHVVFSVFNDFLSDSK